MGTFGPNAYSTLSMINQDAVTAFAIRTLGSQTFLVREIVFNKQDVSLTVWLKDTSMPSNQISVVATTDMVFRCDQTLGSFQKALRLIRPPLSDLASIGTLVKNAAPPRRAIVESELSFGWVEAYRQVWHPPRLELEEGKLLFFCNDSRRGRWEKWTITREMELKVEDFGRGKSALRR